MIETIKINANLLNNKKFLITCACIIMFSIYDNGALHDNLAPIMSSNSYLTKQYFKVITLILIAIITYYSIACCIISHSRILRIVGTLLYFAGVVNAFTFNVSGGFPDAMLIGVAIQDSHFAGAFISNNWKLILYVLGYSSAIFALFIATKARLSLSCSNRIVYPLLLFAIIANCSYVNFTEGRRPAFSGYNVAIASVEAILKQDIPYIQRGKVPTTECTQCPDIVLYIIDESVNYEALSAINSIILQANSFRKRLGVPAFAYKGNSAGNHSSVSNYILRLGVGKSSYPDSNHATLALPNIFSYAKASHYKTVFYDAQSKNHRLQNYMTPYDLADVDHFITSDASSKLYDHDQIALQRLRKFIDEASSNNKVAITLVKTGVHFPYANSIPPQLMDELPAACKSVDTSFSSQKIYCTKAQYEIALKFSVDQFMEQVFSILDGRNFALVYTSDHGQNISSNYQLPHGSSNNTSECEISVPILIAGNIFTDVMQSNTIKSHFQIPPTLMKVFGFASQVNARDVTLWDEWHGGSDFLHDPFGQWQKAVGSCTY